MILLFMKIIWSFSLEKTVCSSYITFKKIEISGNL